MGLFNLPAPFFEWIDAILKVFLSPIARLALWGVAGGVVSMALYWLVSPQQRIRRLKAEVARAQQALAAYEGELAEGLPLIGNALRLAGKQVIVVIGPAIAASLPLLFMLVWMYTAYGYQYPDAQTEIPLHVLPARFEAHWLAKDPEEHGAGVDNPRIVALNKAGQVVTDIALPVPVPVLAKRRWWNLFFGNPAGYLPARGPVDRIEVGLPAKRYLPVGPQWLTGWEGVFFGVLTLCSIAIKWIFRIT